MTELIDGPVTIDVSPGDVLIVGDQRFTVPAGVRHVSVTIIGSGGSDGTDAPVGMGGGTGGGMTATVGSGGNDSTVATGGGFTWSTWSGGKHGSGGNRGSG